MSEITKINENVYGTKDSWKVLNIGNHKTKFPNFSNDGETFGDGIYSGQLKLNEKIDDSICFFGVAGDCDLFCNNAVVWNENSDYIRLNERHETGEILYLTTKYDGEYRHYKDLSVEGRSSVNLMRWSPSATQPDYPAFRYFTSVALDFTYNSTVAVIMISAINENGTGDMIHVPLLDYINNYSSTHSTICGFYPEFYIGSLSSRNKSERGLISVIPYTQYPAYDVDGYFKMDTGLVSYAYSSSLYGCGLNYTYSFINQSAYKNSVVNYFNGSMERWKIREVTRSGVQTLITKFDGTIDDIYKQASFYGVYFTDNTNSAKTSLLGEKCTDEHIFLPVIDDGVLKGEYRRGKATTTLPNSKYTENIREISGYKGIDNIDPTKYTEKISLSTPKIKSEGKFNTLYALSDNELNSLSDELWTADENKLNQILKGLLLMGENPLNCIVSLQLFPFDITSQAGTSTQGSITLGSTQMNTTGTKVKNLNSVIDIGSVKLRRHFNNFFDYEPYSTAFIYVPYCGTIQLSLNDVIGKIVSVKLLIDYITGVCTAVVFADGIPVIYKNGCISQQIAITGTDTATMSSNAISSSLGLLTNTTNLIAGGKDVSSIINNSTNLLSSSFDYSARRTIYQTQGANTSQINMCEPQKAYIVLNLPNFDIADDYGFFHGYRCDFYNSVKNLTGYVETDRPNLTGIAATEEEKQMISEIMTGGFYV